MGALIVPLLALGGIKLYDDYKKKHARNQDRTGAVAIKSPLPRQSQGLRGDLAESSIPSNQIGTQSGAGQPPIFNIRFIGKSPNAGINGKGPTTPPLAKPQFIKFDPFAGFKFNFAAGNAPKLIAPTGGFDIGTAEGGLTGGAAGGGAASGSSGGSSGGSTGGASGGRGRIALNVGQ